MKANNLFKYIAGFFVFVVLHILLVKYFVFYDVALCFLYVGFLIMLPFSLPVPLLLLISFFVGLFVDLFYDTSGVHAAGCVAAMYLRSYIVILLTPMGGYDDVADLSIKSMGLRWFVVFLVIFIFVHHSFVFMLEAFSFSYFYWTVAKIVASTIFSAFMIFAFNFLFFTSSSK